MKGTALELYDPLYAALNVELPMLRDAVGDVEVYIYESWEDDDRMTKDAARRLVKIADIFGWTMDWVEEMRAWSR